MSDCLFCRIAAGEIPADVVLDEEDLLAFRDIQPQGPVHVLVIPRHHIASLNDVGSAETALGGRLLAAAARVATAEGLAATGYRVVINCGRHGCQSVDHLHLHLIGGRQLDWPPG